MTFLRFSKKFIGVNHKWFKTYVDENIGTIRKFYIAEVSHDCSNIKLPGSNDIIEAWSIVNYDYD